MVQFVDDISGVVLVGGEDDFSKNEWHQFKVDIDDYSILRWNANEPSSVDVLDLMIEIEDGTIISWTYQKLINLYQYISLNSAHTPWMIRGITF